jgi:hypothetical protein
MTVYVGDWVNGVREGVGNCYWHAGDQYEGEWKDDKSNGQGMSHSFIHSIWAVVDWLGTFTWGSGSKYIGCWKDGRQDGNGMILGYVI